MNQIFHSHKDRGHVSMGWLDSHHSFSFGHWYNPEKTNFGALRVLNDDIVEPSMGFGTHPHQNMEIVSIPLFGELAHKDSIGTIGVIQTGDVQIMSAGTGIQHSEFNHSNDKKVNFLQIWILPKNKILLQDMIKNHFLDQVGQTNSKPLFHLTMTLLYG